MEYKVKVIIGESFFTPDGYEVIAAEVDETIEVTKPMVSEYGKLSFGEKIVLTQREKTWILSPETVKLSKKTFKNRISVHGIKDNHDLIIKSKDQLEEIENKLIESGIKRMSL